ncbi:putative NADP-dependent alcohol dehydrogenase C 2 [Patellaria atrata CBS 101060]|uniref:alcohol dehydrogenase (NADP(+)) n=1 Tax=Patellaria atrata CBS 101060 TaxID=1346257 RepID=A0A9P4S747_9PEZI|nr:putative NADP-dependent alcohol dehydrogenase C 2 [Patellaria atrata CBS 101060]
MSSDHKFEGWCGLDKDSVKGQMKWQPYDPKPFTDTDVEIRISHCGICASDLHTLRSGWGQTPYPCVVGHEIVGRAVRVGAAVTHIQPGDRVGVGAQSGSCLRPECEECASGIENHCQVSNTNTYAGFFPDGSKSYGGYADYSRVPGHFVIRIPEALDSAAAAPMLCGGITVYSPLKREGCGPGKRVGIVGLGGLGHFGVLFAKALGADEVTVISRSSAKKEDAMRLGADKFIATNEEADWADKYALSLDLIISTVSSPDMPLEGYLGLLRVRGTFIQVGAPEDKLPGFLAFALIVKGCKIGGSAIGSPKEIQEMLHLAVEKKIEPWIQERPLKDANQAVVDMNNGKARFRYVLRNEKHEA